MAPAPPTLSLFTGPPHRAQSIILMANGPVVRTP
jgi:hypothetical protein